jgi:bacteriocin-like protein
MEFQIEESPFQIEHMILSETAYPIELTADELMSISGGAQPIGLITIEK